ncbi:hypothetical protein PR202_gb12377 [Eleusine coracana subsp. coracana]|uniref:Exoribonuclease phosphorolytic domain-containing protein n=1 Tax=Eleusine coracana subsp. coracana TaxID=191504 RepID=A0AAV5EMW4_ELECO|nr:hypothetical protein PR202_gb12377 [Eleusine coracana subsp. coracana]
MLASSAALHLLLPAPPPSHRHHQHLAFALSHPAPPLHAACSRRGARRRHMGASASAALTVEAEENSSGPAKFSVRIPVGDREVFSYDGIHSPDCLAITAAGIAVALSEIPNKQTIAGVRIGLINGQFVVNPNTEQMEKSELDLMMAGTDSAILMIEGYCDFLTEEKLLEAVEAGQVAIREICKAIDVLVQKCGKKKMVDAIGSPPPELYMHVEDISGDELVKALQIKEKNPRRKALSALEEKVITILSEQGYVAKDDSSGATESLADIVEDEDEDEVIVDGEVDEGDVHIKSVSRKPHRQLFSEVDVKLVFKEVSSKFLRRRIVENCLRKIQVKCDKVALARGASENAPNISVVHLCPKEYLVINALLIGG